MSKDIRTQPEVLIIGGGPAGLVMAAELLALGLKPIIVERRSERELFETRSAFFNITPAGTNALLRLANEEVVDTIAWSGATYEEWSLVNDRTGKVVKSARPDSMGPEAGFPLVIERHRMLQGVRRLIPNDLLRCEASVRRIDAASGEVELESGELLRADLIIGADGVHSRARKSVFGDTGLRSQGLLSLFAVIPATEAIKGVCPPGSVFISDAGFYHTDDERAHWYITTELDQPFIATPPQPMGGWLSFARGIVGKTGDPRMSALMDATREGEMITTMSVDRDPLLSFTSGRLILIGDAAHPFTPYASQGTSQALVDIFTLSYLLRRDTMQLEGGGLTGSLATVKREYDALRVGPVNRLMETSRKLGAQFSRKRGLMTLLSMLVFRFGPSRWLLPPGGADCDPNGFAPMTEAERREYHDRLSRTRSRWKAIA